MSQGEPVRRGEVWMVELFPRSGSEQKGVRPVILVSSDGFNQSPNWQSLIVIPVSIPVSSSQNQRKRLRTAVPLPAAEGGLSRESVALCHQITTLDRGKFSQRLGVLSSSTMTDIEEGIRSALDFPR